MYCIDASVILSAALGTEPYSLKSTEFLHSVRDRKEKVFFPEIVVPEIASGLFRVTQNKIFTDDFITGFRAVPNFTLVPLDGKLSTVAVEVITQTGLKGADSVYVALAYEYGLVLVTLDKEQSVKAKNFVHVISP